MQNQYEQRIYLEAKKALNELLQWAVDQGVEQSVIVYQVAKAADDSTRLKRSAIIHRNDIVTD